MDDFYAVVGIDRAASAEEIDKKVREQLRIWQRRTTNADLSRRQEAERRVQLLGEARTTLLDVQKRRHYDLQLSVRPRPSFPAAEAETGEVDWLARARQSLAGNDYQSAASAARQARDANPTAEAWGLLARANAGLGNLDDALYEAKQAVSMSSENAQAWLDLAHVYEQRGDWQDAFEQYEVASRLDPQAEAPEAGMTRSLASSSNPTEVVDRLERRYARALPADRPAAGRLLGKALFTAAERVARGPGSASLRITTQGQVDEIGRLLGRARQVTSDPGVVRAVAELERLIVRSRQGTQYGTGQFRTTTGSYRPHRPARSGPPRTNNLAIAAFVVSLCGLVFCIAGPVGAIMGHVARGQIRDSDELGGGMAQAGIVIGWLVTVLWVCGLGTVIANG
jgi:tetratricopeptide (TPR) repeat protein